MAGKPVFKASEMAEQPQSWLPALKEGMTAASRSEAVKIWPGSAEGMPPYFDYRIEHVLQVERLALWLMGFEGGDLDVVLASVWVHDRFKPQVEGRDHAAAAAEWFRANGSAMGFPAGKILRVCHAVENHAGFVPPLDLVGPDKVEARILFDADKLDKFGLHAVIYGVLAHAAYPAVPLTLESVANPARSLPCAKEIRERFFFQRSADLAARNIQRQTDFYRALKDELGLP